MNKQEIKEKLKERFNLTDEQIERIYEKFIQEYPSTDFGWASEVYLEAKPFKVNENIFETNQKWNDESHYLMRLVASEKMSEVFDALLIDKNDPNVAEDYSVGNIGTTGRVIKMWSGANIHDDRELMGGRFHKPVRLAKFPNEISNDSYPNPIIKEVDLTAVCSHHYAPFGTLVSSNPDAKVIVAYIPDKYVLGISKLQRVVRYIAQRGWLQEDLTKAIYDKISETAETKSVYVKLKNIEHSCEKYRGAMSQGNGFTTEFYGGDFRSNQALLQMVRNY